MEIIERLPRAQPGDPGLAFSVNGQQAVNGDGVAKAVIDQRLQERLETVESWVVHDLRRTVAIGMAQLGIAPHVLDRVLNHVSGTIRGVAAVYNRFTYKAERQAALDAWGRYLEGLVYPERARRNVVDLRPVAAQ
jgi:hypothetical protein